MIPDNIRCARDRAHLAGAEWVVARKKADATTDLALAADLRITAADARGRYFRELAAIDALLGFTPSTFGSLG